MAMYYQGSSEIQGDHNLQTLYLMNPNYVGYSDTQQPPLYSNPAAGVPHAPPHQFVGIPLSHDPSRPSPAQEHIQAVHYNIWGLVDHHQSEYGSNLNQPNTPQQETPKPLSLSLTPHETINQDFLGQIISPKNNNCSSSSPMSLTTTDHRSNGVINNRVESVIMGSKYVKAAQELLDEVANVGNGTKIIDKAKMVYKETSVCKNGDVLSGGGGDSGNKNGGAAAELTTAQRQEIQMKKAKLNSMLDEVEQRYKQYHHQMQIVVSSFEQVAGIGSAKSYTHLALKTILKQFKCLKNTISHQIKALSKSLGEEENSGTKIEGSRLKFVDHQLRQQRTLQQLGMMQNNAWRPQRGLPERAVSVLRAWLFEHFLHPYPKDSDKHMLAKQTGLTRSQVSNWFINARVRLWKPMVEDMYLEEMKNQETITPDKDNTTKPEPDRELIGSKSNPRQENNITPPILKNLVTNPSPSDISVSTVITSPTGPSFQPRPGFAQLINSLNTEKYPKKPRNENQADIDNSPSSILCVDRVDKPGRFTFSANNQGQIGENYLSGFNNTYGNIISELPDRFSNGDRQIPTGFLGNNNNNNFSLTLAPPTLQGVHQQNFFEFGTRIGSSEVVESNRVNGINNLQASHDHSNVGNYQILDFQNRKLFHNHFVA